MMNIHKVVLILIAYPCLAFMALAQEALPSSSTTRPSSALEYRDFSETVVPVASLKVRPSLRLGVSGRPAPGLDIDGSLGTGFCLDSACSFIVTAYHVAEIAQPGKVKGDKITKRYFATGPQDEGATVNTVAGGSALVFATKRDLAVFELKHPLPHHHGLPYNLDDLEFGQEVEIYGYPGGNNKFVRELGRISATFKGETLSGLLGFEYQTPPTSIKRIAGASGGIVVDKKTEAILGILVQTTETTALAVPVQTLVDFVSKVQPLLAENTFPKDVLSLIDLHPKFAPPPDYNPKFVAGVADGLRHRPEEPSEIRALRSKAQLLAVSMPNYIAVQSFVWGKGENEPDAEEEYEIRVTDGVQRFRKYPDGKKESEGIPNPSLSGWVLPSDQWSRLPKMIGTEFGLKVHQARDVFVKKHRMKVFQYYASVEDNLCPFEPVDDYGFFTLGRTVAVACYGEVWTDEDMNIIRVSENLDLSDELKVYRGWTAFQVVVTYGWLNHANESPQLVPISIFTAARRKRHTYWCRGVFTNYRTFSSKAKMVANN